MVPNPFNVNPGDFVFICERYILAVYIYRVSIVIILKSHEEKKNNTKFIKTFAELIMSNLMIKPVSTSCLNPYLCSSLTFQLFSSF